jgi:hypothetical protein
MNLGFQSLVALITTLDILNRGYLLAISIRILKPKTGCNPSSNENIAPSDFIARSLPVRFPSGFV